MTHHYSKTELALRYFPDMSKESSLRKLMREIKGCPDLMGLLLEAGYKKSQKLLSPRQVSLITCYLGDPIRA